MKVFAALFLGYFLAAASALAAEPPETTLPPVFVTSTRTEVPLEQVTTSVTVITAQEIENQRAETVLEVLRQVPGLDVVQTGSRGTNTSVFIRGADADQVLVLIDGVEVNSTTLGAFNFAHLTTENIERIEILRGAGGTLYGSQAIGGVINIITKRGRGPAEFGISAEGGNGSTHRQTLNLNGEFGKLGYAFSGARMESDGFRPFNDDYRNLAASARLDYRVMDDALLTGVFRFNKTDAGLFNSNNFVPGGRDPNAREAVTQYLGKAQWEHHILPEWDYRIAGSIFKEHIKDSDEPDPLADCQFFGFPCDSRTRSRFRPQISSAEFQTNYRYGDWSTTTFGAEFKRRKASTSSSSDGASLGEINRAIRNMGYYLQEQVKMFEERLILISGIRLDDHQTFGTEWSPSFSSSYRIGKSGTRIKAGYAQGFKAPTLNELFFPAGFGCPAFGNPDLEPETSWEVNAGVDQDLLGDRLTFGLTYFHREVKNLIEGQPIPDDPFGCFRAENVGGARFDGVETTLAFKILPSLRVDANYTFLHWNTADGTLLRRAQHRGSVSLNYVLDGLNVNFVANIVGRRDDFRAAIPFGTIEMPGYAIFDLAASYILPWRMPGAKSLTLFGKIENLFDRKYQEADGFRARPLNFLIGLRTVFGR